MSETIYGIHVSVMGLPEYDLKPGSFARKLVYRSYKNKYHVEPTMPLVCQNYIDLSELGHENIIGIYASYMAGHDRLSMLNCPIERIADYLKSKYTPGKFIVFDNCQEGDVAAVVSRIHAALNLTDIPPAVVYYISGAYNVKEAYKEFCELHNISQYINVYHANPWECSPYTPYMLPVFNKGPRDKLLLSFNRITRPHRTILLSLLLDAELVDRSYYSYFPNASHGGLPESSTQVIKDFLKDDVLSEKAINAYNSNSARFPLLLNITQNYNKTYIDTDDMNYFSNSYFSLVTETFFFDLTRRVNTQQYVEPAIFFSEKIYKPIFMKHPFILAGRPGSLTALKEMGYRTFSPYIDETYDTIYNDTDRIAAIVNEVKRLSTQSDSDWIKWQANIEEIVEHNYRTLIDRVCNLKKVKVKKNDL